MPTQPNKSSVYIDTTIFSVIVARPSANVIAAGHQQTTCIWWQNDADQFHLYTSDAVYYEALEGDPEMARQRLAYIASVERLPITAEAFQLGDELLARRLLPATAKTDAFHLAIATVHAIEFLLTWNCRHLANAILYRRIAKELERLGYNPTVVCTPQQLSGVRT